MWCIYDIEWHICSWHKSGYSILNESCSLFLLPVCAVIWDLYVDYSIREVGHTCVM